MRSSIAIPMSALMIDFDADLILTGLIEAGSAEDMLDDRLAVEGDDQGVNALNLGGS